MATTGRPPGEVAPAHAPLLDAAHAALLDPAHAALLDHLLVLVLRFAPEDGRLLLVSKPSTRLVDRTPDEVLASGIDALLPDDATRALLRALVARAAGGEEVPWTELTLVRHGGRRIATRALLYPLRRDGAVVAVEAIVRDVQAEMDARRKLVEQDRLASIGQLAAGVAHEINNPATFVALNVQQLVRALPQIRAGTADLATLTRFEATLADVAEGVQRIVATIGELKLFARIPEGAFSTPVDVNRLVQSAVALTRSAIRRRATVELDLGDLPLVPGDHAHVAQVFAALLLNAAQAIPAGAEKDHLVRVETRADDGWVRVRVSDSGVGIPGEVLPRIFDPFFSTWPEPGVGLGLAISADYVRRMGGAIEVESAPGVGTTFTVLLPATEVEPRAEPPRPQVLIVDDERSLAQAMARQLAGRYEVELAHDGREAKRVLLERRYDVVLCDLRVPGLSGQELYDAIAAERPELASRFVFVTGGFDAESAAFLGRARRPVLDKPFAAEELDRVVREVAATSAAPARAAP